MSPIKLMFSTSSILEKAGRLILGIWTILVGAKIVNPTSRKTRRIFLHPRELFPSPPKNTKKDFFFLVDICSVKTTIQIGRRHIGI